MSDVRCPMCGRPNPEASAACQFCGARIKPLVIHPRDERDDRVNPAPIPPTPAPAGGESEPAADQGIPDWLARIRSLEPDPPASTPSEGEDLASDPGPPWPERTAEPAAGDADPGGDWLNAIRRQATPLKTAPLPGPEEHEEETDWLARLRTQHEAEAPRFPKPQVEPPPAPAPDLGASRSRRGVNDLFRSQAAAPPPDLPEPSAPPPPAEPAVPHWLESIRRSETSQSPAEPEPPAAPAGESLPDWLKPVSGDPDWLTATRLPDPPPAASPEVTPDTSAFDFLQASPAPSEPSPGLTPADLPDWLAAMRPDDLGVTSSPPPPAPASPSGDQPATPRRIPPAPPPPGDLTPGQLPSWLEAMRPIESSAPKALGDDDRTENSGPLAGVRGVLGAEPVIAMPHKPPVLSSRLEVSDVHAAQAELLRGFLIEEIREKPLSKRRRFDIKIDRWLVVLALVAAVVAPVVLGGQTLASPLGAPRESFAVYNAVDSLPAAAPVLLAFEYGPASVGELDAQAKTLIDHLMIRGARLTVVSSQPAGAAIGQAAIQRLASDHGYVYGENYVHLGYLSGGSTGLLDFAIEPRTAVVRDYSGALVPWDTPALSGVGAVSDFKLIVVFAASPESGRAWIEQVHSLSTGTPMAGVVSAGAETLLRPYYESDAPQLVGLITGLNGAAGYEVMTGRPALARERWDGYGYGLLVATGAIALGNLISAVAGLAKRKKSEA